MSENDDEALRARADTLARALKSAQSSRPRDAAPPPAQAAATGAALSLAVRASSEMVAGVVVGGVIGWGIDRLFHTKPVFLILFLAFGCAAGIANVIRTTSPKSGT